MRSRQINPSDLSGGTAAMRSETAQKRFLMTIMGAAIALIALLVASMVPGNARAAEDAPLCTPNVQFDPSIRTFEQVTGKQLGAGSTGTSSRSDTATLYSYLDAVVADTADNPRVRVIKKSLGTTELGRDFPMVIVGTPDNIANLDAGRNDAAFWRGVRNGDISAAEGRSQIDQRPAFGFLTGTPHGTEAAGGDSIMRILYELAARTDCSNQQRLKNLDHFLIPTRNPDGRDNNVRTSAWSFDHNRDVGVRTQSESKFAFYGSNPYPNIYYVDAHQQSNGYFFPPNEDPVHAEISDTSVDLINDTFGAAMQRKFNDQSSPYQNYNTYDLFAPVFGDSVPSLMWGGAGMTYEKGTSELYSKQVYDHYLAMDETINVASRDKKRIMTEWINQWEEATEQGENCMLEENELVSPLHDTIVQQPNVPVCGYYYLPDNHPGDTAKLLQELQEVDVKVFELTEDTTVNGAHEIGPGGEEDGVVLPEGTLWIPLAQTQKHWIQAVLGEDPFVPFYFFYDVAQWSYSHTWGMSGGNGLLRDPMPANAPMEEVDWVDFGGVTDPAKPVLAFKTDSSKGMAMVVDLLAEGATVYRGTEAFEAGGRSFPTGTAMVDASTLGDTDIAELADEWDSPVTGLDNYPVSRYDMGDAPKIGIFTGTATVPATPISEPQGQCSTSAYCVPMFGLTQKFGFAPTTNTDEDTPLIVPVTTTDLATSGTWLKDNGFTAIYTSAGAVTNPTALLNIQDFVSTGGNFVGSGANTLTTARSAGITLMNTSPTNVAPFTDPCPSGSGLRTNGANFPADIDTDNPVGWSYDNGGSIFRAGGVAIDGATLGGAGAIQQATAVFSYPDPLVSFGYTCNATGPGELPGRPAITSQEFGAGSFTFFDSDPFYRSWLPQQERTALNAFLNPTGPELAPTTAPAASFTGLDRADKPVAAAKLPDVKARPAVKSYDPNRTLKITVKRGKANRKAKVLRKAVKAAKVPAKTKKKIKWVSKKKTLTMKIRNGKAFDHETMPLWMHRVSTYLTKHKVQSIRWEVDRGGS